VPIELGERRRVDDARRVSHLDHMLQFVSEDHRLQLTR
jgi:hypothetical protein